MKFKIGDKVKGIPTEKPYGYFSSLKDVVGIISALSYDDYVVDFYKRIKNTDDQDSTHSCGDRLVDDTGRYFRENELVLVYEK